MTSFEKSTLILMVIGIVVPIIANLGLGKDKLPEIEKLIYRPSSPVSFLTENKSLSEDTRLVVAGVAYDHIIIQHVRLDNIGEVVVEPKDFFEPFTVSVKAPYRILNVETITRRGSFDVEWTRINDRKFSAAPFLFNPKETVYFQVYIVHDDPEAVKNMPPDFTSNKYNFDVSVRIKGLAEFVDHNTTHDVKIFGFLVVLDASRVLVLIVAASFWLICYVKLLEKNGIVLSLTSIRKTLAVIGTVSFCYAVGVVTVFLLLGPVGVPKEHVEYRYTTLRLGGAIYFLHILFLLSLGIRGYR